MTYMITIDGDIKKEELLKLISAKGHTASIEEMDSSSLKRLSELASAFEEVKQHKEGKVELQTLDEMLDEI